MATQEEIDASLVALNPDLHLLANTFVPDMFGYKQKVNNAIDNDPQVKAIIEDGVSRVLVAAEHVRAGKPPPAPKAGQSLKAYLTSTEGEVI